MQSLGFQKYIAQICTFTAFYSDHPTLLQTSKLLGPHSFGSISPGYAWHTLNHSSFLLLFCSQHSSRVVWGIMLDPLKEMLCLYACLPHFGGLLRGLGEGTMQCWTLLPCFILRWQGNYTDVCTPVWPQDLLFHVDTVSWWGRSSIWQAGHWMPGSMPYSMPMLWWL